MGVIAKQSVSLWVGDWTKDVKATIDEAITVAKTATRSIVIYNIPDRDKGAYSAGGVSDRAAYEAFIMQVALGIRGRKCILILEPDALPLSTRDFTAQEQADRKSILSNAVQVLTASGADVYIDAGDSNWIPSADMAKLLTAAGVTYAKGFALNVSHTEFEKDETAYANKIRAIIGMDKHFVIDTSRSGLGAYKLLAGDDSQMAWCNPPGRALGSLPTLTTGVEGCDAFLWIKPPGESDGQFPKGAPAPGRFWPEYALDLVKRSVHAPKV